MIKSARVVTKDAAGWNLEFDNSEKKIPASARFVVKLDQETFHAVCVNGEIWWRFDDLLRAFSMDDKIGICCGINENLESIGDPHHTEEYGLHLNASGLGALFAYSSRNAFSVASNSAGEDYFRDWDVKPPIEGSIIIDAIRSSYKSVDIPALDKIKLDPAIEKEVTGLQSAVRHLNRRIQHYTDTYKVLSQITIQSAQSKSGSK